MVNIKYLEDVEAWQAARELTQSIYAHSRRKPFALDYGLVDQIRRSAISIMSNIAEGFESQTDRTFVRFLGIAKASAGELRSQLYIALDQKYISEEEFKSRLNYAGVFHAKPLVSGNTLRNPRP